MKKTILAAALVLAAGFAGAVNAQGGARLLGVATLDAREGDRDRVAVSCRPRVAAIKLRSVGDTAEIRRVALTYGNGERDVVRVRDVLPRGGETRWIDLPGGRRCVTSVTVVGDAERGWRDDEGHGRYRRDDAGYDRDDRYGRYDRDDRYGRYDRDDRYGRYDRYDRRYVRHDRDWDDRRGRRPFAAVEIYGRFYR